MADTPCRVVVVPHSAARVRQPPPHCDTASQVSSPFMSLQHPGGQWCMVRYADGISPGIMLETDCTSTTTLQAYNGT